MFLRLLQGTFGASAKRVVPLLIVVAAYLQAAGVSQLIKTKVAPNAEFVGAPTPSQPIIADIAPLLLEHATSARPILDRNPFDSVTSRPLDRHFAFSENPKELEKVPRCEGLKASIVVAAPTPAVSVVAISDGGPESVLLRVGDPIADKTVQLIDWNRVVLSYGSSLCQIRMFDRSKRAMGQRPPPISHPLPSFSVESAEIASKIKKVGPNEYSVDREAVNKILESPMELLRAVRLVPEQRDGRGVGLLLVAVAADSVPAALGLERGDKLLSVNGFDLSDVQTALEAYARLRTADHLALRLERRGQIVKIGYSIK